MFFNMIEVWKDIEGYAGKYQISNLGRVKSLPRIYICGHGTKRKAQGGVLKGTIDNKGYVRIQLSRRTFKVHRLVAQYFIDNPNNLPQVNHINGNKKDNRVENLEWVDNSTNQLHAWRNGLQKESNKRGVQLKMTHSTTGEILYFNSIQQAVDYFGGRSSYPSIIQKNLSHKYGFKTFKGYVVERI